VRIHLVDGTYELFRAYFGAPKAAGVDGVEVGATRGLLWSMLSLLREDRVTHVGCAFDHVIESFRNDLFDGYKSSAGVPEDLLAQFPLAERATHALGLVTWPMIEFEADDALATAASRWSEETEVEQIVICTPDKDMAQCVRGSRVVCVDRMRRKTIDELAVVEKYGVPPLSIPDWLALVGDSSDGYPGIARWGAKSAAAVLARYGHLESIPDHERDWGLIVRGASTLANSLRDHREEAYLYRRLATLRTDAPIEDTLDDLRWRGARRSELTELCRQLGNLDFLERVPQWRDDDASRGRENDRDGY
jgi:5'-3' exonuclease